MTFTEWTAADSATRIAVPTAADDKYSRGVLGIVTGSTQYPGAAVLGVESAMRTGVGMIRYLGPERPTQLVLHRRPEVVTSAGRVQGWLLGSGIDATTRDTSTTDQLTDALGQALPTVIDAGALDLLGVASGPVIITPHYGELSRVLGIEKAEIAADPGEWAARASERLGVTVLLKGARTHLADPYGTRLSVTSATAWTATAGSGDALGGILGALVATHAEGIAADETLLAKLGATASVLHGLAAARASSAGRTASSAGRTASSNTGGPFTVLDLAENLSAVVAGLLES